MTSLLILHSNSNALCALEASRQNMRSRFLTDPHSFSNFAGEHQLPCCMSSHCSWWKQRKLHTYVNRLKHEDSKHQSQALFVIESPMTNNTATQAWAELAYKSQLHIAIDSVRMWGKKLLIQALLHKKFMGRLAKIAGKLLQYFLSCCFGSQSMRCCHSK